MLWGDFGFLNAGVRLSSWFSEVLVGVQRVYAVLLGLLRLVLVYSGSSDRLTPSASANIFRVFGRGFDLPLR